MSDKGKILRFPDTAAIEAEAAAWVARFDLGDVSAKDQAMFQEWLNRSALHREIIAECGELWSELDLLQSLTASEWAGAQIPEQAIRGRSRIRTRQWLAACAAAVLIIFVAGAAVSHFQAERLAKGSLSSATLSYETAVGAEKLVALADGSTVILSSNSKIDVRFSGQNRDVHLARGEAFFDVVHDQARPFAVYAKDYVVRDIGTAFHVHLSKAGGVEVGVTKGSVQIKPANGTQAFGPGESGAILTAGQSIVLGPSVAPPKESSADTEGEQALRRGQLVYTGQPLRKVLADLSHYSGIRIDLADPALENLPVGGAFRIDQIQVILTTLEKNFGLRAQWINPRHLRFTSRRERPIAKD